MAAESKGVETEKHKIYKKKKSESLCDDNLQSCVLGSGNLPIHLIQH